VNGRCRRVAGAALVGVLVAGCSGAQPDPTQPATTAPTSIDGVPSASPTEGDGLPQATLGIVEFPPAGPCWASADADSDTGWVSFEDLGRVFEVDLISGAIATVLQVPAAPCLIEFADGQMWVSSDDATVRRIDQESGEVLAEVELTGNAWAMRSAYGSLFVLDRSLPGLRRLDATTGAETGSVRIDQQPAGIVPAGGGLWIARQTAGSVVRVDPDTMTTTDEIALGADVWMLDGDEQSLWVTGAHAGAIWRIDLATGQVGQPIDVGGEPRGIRVTDTAVWVADVTGSLHVIDAADGTVVRTIDTAPRTSWAIPMGEQMWILEPRRVIRLDPAGL
jgi:DNA-binding beta-propeller fold protein YncE